MDPYDDRAELDRYVWDHHSALFSEFELSVRRAHRTELKAGGVGSAARRLLRERWGADRDAEVAAALARGWRSFRTAARERVMREHTGVVINRCPACCCVVKTPLAKQCL